MGYPARAKCYPRPMPLQLVCFTPGFDRPILPTSSHGHHFVITATDYFTKWVKTIPMVKGKGVAFIYTHILYGLGRVASAPPPEQLLLLNPRKALSLAGAALILYNLRRQLSHSRPWVGFSSSPLFGK